MKKFNKERVIIELSSGNSLYFRSWTLAQRPGGYCTYWCDSTVNDPDEKEGWHYIPTEKALGYIKRAKEGTLEISLLCWGCEEYSFQRWGWRGGYLCQINPLAVFEIAKTEGCL